MKLTSDILLSVAQSANLYLPDDQLEKHTRDIARILEALEKLPEVEYDGTECMPAVHASVLREDKVMPSLSQKEALQNAQHEAGCFVVPRMIE